MGSSWKPRGEGWSQGRKATGRPGGKEETGGDRQSPGSTFQRSSSQFRAGLTVWAAGLGTSCASRPAPAEPRDPGRASPARDGTCSCCGDACSTAALRAAMPPSPRAAGLRRAAHRGPGVLRCRWGPSGRRSGRPRPGRRGAAAGAGGHRGALGKRCASSAVERLTRGVAVARGALWDPGLAVEKPSCQRGLQGNV